MKQRSYISLMSILVFSLFSFFSLTAQTSSDANTYTVSNTGTADVNGIYAQNSTFNGYVKYDKVSGSGGWFVYVSTDGGGPDKYWTIGQVVVLSGIPFYYYYGPVASPTNDTFPIDVATNNWQNNAGGLGGTPFPITTLNTTANITFLNGSAFSAPDGTPGTSNNVIGRFQLTGSSVGGVLQALTIALDNISGVSNVKLWSSTDAIFNSGSDTQLGSAQTAATSVIFSGFNNLVDNTSGTYYFVTIDIAGGSTGTITPTIPNQSSFTFVGANNPTAFTSAPLSSGAVPLPVELTTFSANIKENSVFLNWATATEINNFGFDIERSIGSEKWEKIGFVNGYGNSNSTKTYSFEDKQFPFAMLTYRLKQIDIDGKFEYSKLNTELDARNGIDTDFSLEQNYPNPFNPATRISYQLNEQSHVNLKIFDAIGNEIAQLINENKVAGKHDLEFNASHLSAGIYYYRLVSDKKIITRKMILMK